MANTVYGPYSPTTWANGTTPVNATHMNNLETEASIALHGFNPSLIGAGFVYSGVVCTKDASTATQLDIASGTAYVLLSDGTVGEIAVSSTTQTTSTPSTTYYLDLNPDGSWSWGTSHSGVTNHLTICSVTTDGSGNIITVTDQRVTSVQVGTGAMAPTVGAQNLAASVTPSQAAAPVGGITFGGAAFVSGDSAAKSALFNGTTGYIQFPITGLPTGASAWTLEAWVKPTNATNGSNAVVLSLGDGGTSNQSGFINQVAAGGWSVGLWGTSASGGTSAAATLHHVVGTYDGTNLRLYVDGTLVGGPTAATGAIAGTHAVIGAIWTGSAIGQFFPGSGAEAAIYGTALSASRVTAHFTAGTAGAYAATVLADSPLRYYRLGEAAATSYVNSSVASTLATAAGTDGSSALGRVASVGGQASAGTLGAPVIVAQALNQSVTSTGLQTILSFSPSVAGLYRVSGNIAFVNTTNEAIIAAVNWSDPTLGGTWGTYFSTPQAIAAVHTPMLLDGGTTVNHGVPIPLNPTSFYAGTGGPITCTFNDPGGAPADKVTFIIERLA